MNRKSKCILALFCAVSLLLSSLNFVLAEEEQPNFTIEQAESVGVGEWVSITMFANDPLPSVSSLELEFAYDTSYLKLVMDPLTEEYFEFGRSCNGFLKLGYHETMRVALIAMDRILKAGELVTLRFEVTNPIPQDYLAQVTAKVLSAGDGEGNALTLTCAGGGVLGKEEPQKPATPTDSPIEKTPYGDPNEDGSIDAKDALMVLKSAVNKLVLTEKQALAAEVDGLEGINAKDALLMLRFAVNKINQFPIEQL